MSANGNSGRFGRVRALELQKRDGLVVVELYKGCFGHESEPTQAEQNNAASNNIRNGEVVNPSQAEPFLP